MSRNFLRIPLVICLIFFCIAVSVSPAHSVLDGVKEDLDSASRKTTRIIKNVDKDGNDKPNTRHTFEVGTLNYFLTERGKSIADTESNRAPCKICKKPWIQCLGIDGGVEGAIKAKAKELNTLLYKMEASN